jgi:hypothetical protein
MISISDIATIGKKYLLSDYHINYLFQFITEYDPTGKDILEVGGAMPPEIVIDLFKANSWTATEAPNYDLDLNSPSNQQTILNSQGLNQENYKAILKNIEDYDGNLSGSYDCIFSIACFEHIAKFLRR